MVAGENLPLTSFLPWIKHSSCIISTVCQFINSCGLFFPSNFVVLPVGFSGLVASARTPLLCVFTSPLKGRPVHRLGHSPGETKRRRGKRWLMGESSAPASDLAPAKLWTAWSLHRQQQTNKWQTAEVFQRRQQQAEQRHQEFLLWSLWVPYSGCSMQLSLLSRPVPVSVFIPLLSRQLAVSTSCCAHEGWFSARTCSF